MQQIIDEDLVDDIEDILKDWLFDNGTYNELKWKIYNLVLIKQTEAIVNNKVK